MLCIARGLFSALVFADVVNGRVLFEKEKEEVSFLHRAKAKVEEKNVKVEETAFVELAADCRSEGQIAMCGRHPGAYIGHADGACQCPKAGAPSGAGGAAVAQPKAAAPQSVQPAVGQQLAQQPQQSSGGSCAGASGQCGVPGTAFAHCFEDRRASPSCQTKPASGSPQCLSKPIPPDGAASSAEKDKVVQAEARMTRVVAKKSPSSGKCMCWDINAKNQDPENYSPC